MPITGIDRVNQAFTRYLLEQQENAIEEAIGILSLVGEECVAEARTSGKYTDRTGNLRSSVGFAVLRNGEVVRMSSFDKVKETAVDAKPIGTALINQLASQFDTGLALIVVAGMNYAVYVEAKALNVLNSAQDLGETLVPQMLRKAGLINGTNSFT